MNSMKMAQRIGIGAYNMVYDKCNEPPPGETWVDKYDEYMSWVGGPSVTQAQRAVYASRIEALYDLGVYEHLSALYFFDAPVLDATLINVIRPGLLGLAPVRPDAYVPYVGWGGTMDDVYSMESTMLAREYIDSVNSYSFGCRITGNDGSVKGQRHLMGAGDNQTGNMCGIVFDGYDTLIFDAVSAYSANVTPDANMSVTVSEGMMSLFSKGVEVFSENAITGSNALETSIVFLRQLDDVMYEGQIQYYYVGRPISLDMMNGIDAIFMQNPMTEI